MHRRSLSGTHPCAALFKPGRSGPPNTFAHRCILPWACRGCRQHAGESGVVDFAGEAQAHFWIRIPLIYDDVWMQQPCRPCYLSTSPKHVRDGRGSLGECRGVVFRGRGSGARPLIEVASPLTQRDPPLRSVIQTRAQRSPQYVRSPMHPPVGPSYMPATCGGEWRSRLRRGGSGSFLDKDPTDLRRCMDATTLSSLLPEHVT